MGFKLITGNTSESAEGIYAEDDAAIYQSIFGADGVFNIGSKLEASTAGTNTIRIRDGVLICGGHIARNQYEDLGYEDVTIQNGTTGRKRNDLIVAEFSTIGFKATDTFTLKVLQGTSTTGTPVDPTVVQENIYTGGKTRQFPLYRVRVEGATIKAPEKLFSIIPTIPELVNVDTSIQVYEENSWRVSYYNVSPTEKYVRIERQFLNGLETRGFTTIISSLPFSVKSCLISGMVHTASAPVGHAWAKIEGNQIQISNGTYTQSMYITCFGVVKVEQEG